MDFKDLLRLARRRWKTIMSFFALAIIAAAGLSFAATPQYHSTSKVFISTDVTNPATAFYASAFSSQRVQSYADLATSGEVLKNVIDRLQLNMTPEQLAGKIKAEVPTNTVIITLEVTDPSARNAQEIAQAEAQELTAYLSDVETPRGKATSPVKATITDNARFDGNPVSPRTVLNLAVAALLGLLIGFGVAVVRDLLDNTVSSPQDVEDTVEAPLLTSVGYDGDVPKNPLITDTGTHAPRAEAFRLLRTNLQFLSLDTPPRALVITSSLPGEGKTSTAVNLAITLAQAGKRVLLIDGDLRRPKVASMLGLEHAVGLTTVLVGRSDLHESIQKHTESGIYLLASGPIPPNPTEILQSRAANDLIDQLSGMFDMVIIDAPPLLPVSDAAIIASDVDGAILVVQHGKTTKEQLRQAASRLKQVDATLLGVAVNMTPRRNSRSYQYGYEYGYGYEYEPVSTKTK